MTLFFVLSGFLITYLLLEEKRHTGTVDVGKFYQRRMLRIWPLYYVTVGLAFFVFPAFITIPTWNVGLHEAFFGSRLSLYLFLLPNVAQVALPLVPFAAPRWSVGVEEQFYAFWPLVCRLGNRYIPHALLLIIVTLVGSRLFALHMGASRLSAALRVAAQFLYYFRIPCMAFGGLGAWLLQERGGKLLKFVFTPGAQWAALLISTGLNVFPIDLLGDMRQEISAVFYAVLIVNAAGNPGSIIRLEQAVPRYLGRISYGIYVYQILAMRIIFLLIQRYGNFAEPLYSVGAMYAGSFALTVALAAVSYHVFEKKFIDLKSR